MGWALLALTVAQLRLDTDIAAMRQSGAAVLARDANRRADKAWRRLMNLVAA